MRRILAWAVSSVFLAGAVFMQLPAQAQQGEVDQHQRAAELVRLWEQLPQTRDPAELIAGAERALKLEGELGTWPLPVTRDEARARLWRWVGQGYAERSGGKAEDLKAAIAAYERALETVTRGKAPKDWALLQADLADAYWALSPVGDRTETVEKAIAGREAALTVLNRQESPLEWAEVQINLGLAYQGRIRGERADNLEKAIAAYEIALTVLTRDANPHAWSATHDNLATAYRDRVRGEPADNQEKAIAHYEAALTVRTREAFPTEWLLRKPIWASLIRTASAATARRTWRRSYPPTRPLLRSERARQARAIGRGRRTVSPRPIATACAGSVPKTRKRRSPSTRRR